MTSVSFEFFPPATMQGSFRLWDTLTALAPFDPSFVSVTYGAGGTTRARTHEAVEAIHAATGLTVAGHLTCVDQTRAETLAIADAYAKAGVTEIVALRGDPPKGTDRFEAHPEGFASSIALIEALADTGKFTLRVAAYPEPHPEDTDRTSAIAHLKAKFDAGATSALTQFFFDPEDFLRFRDDCAAAGIDAPILPGILPIESWTGLRKFAARCGASLPKVLIDAFEKAKPEDHQLLATAVATELCDTLMGQGVDHLHLFTLNKPDLTRDVLSALGLRPKAQLQKVA